jgi:hypothetical protein
MKRSDLTFVILHNCYLDCWVTGMGAQNLSNIFVVLLRYTNAMVSVRRARHVIVSQYVWRLVFFSDVTETILSALNSSYLLDEKLAIGSLVSSFGSMVFKLSLSKTVDLVLQYYWSLGDLPVRWNTSLLYQTFVSLKGNLQAREVCRYVS